MNHVKRHEQQPSSSSFFVENHNNILCFYDLCWLTTKKFVEIIPFFVCFILKSCPGESPIGESVPVHIKQEVPFCVTATFKKKCTHNIDENKWNL